MTDLIIIRGIPGSGKSTLAKAFVGVGYEHFESDMYFLSDPAREETYQFRKAGLPNAHEWCRRAVSHALSKDRRVVVSNTFTRYWEFMPYIQLAVEFRKSHSVIVARGEFQNVHSVPQDIVAAMRARWED